jgi:DNA-binding SARP family transcriptional activator/ActR/RegA family two-component response regulator
MQHTDILIVEDRTDWQAIIGAALAREGYSTHSTTSYLDAVAALEQQHFSLAIIDPVLDTGNRFNRDGLSVIQRIRALQPHMAIIIITGSLTRDMQTSLHQLCPGSPALLKESWEPASFATLVRQMMHNQRQEDTSSGTAEPAAPTAPESAMSAPPALEACPPGCPRVLLVENRPDWQAIVSRVLGSAGYFWRTASTAQAALHELEQESFHLVILDLKLQDNDLPITSSEGWLLLDYLVETQPNSRMLILSGKACPGDVAYLLTRYPVIGFIEKQRFTPQAIIEAVAQATRAPVLRLQTFGQFRIWRDNQAITTWERPQAETIVKLLLVRRAQGGRAVAADELITRLWPDADEESGRKKLLPLMSNARHTLEPDIEPRDSHFIVRSSNGYFFDINGPVTWDLLHFREHMRLGQQLAQELRWEAAVSELEKGRALYVGDFLAEDMYVDWVIDLRRETVSNFCDGMLCLADCYTALRQFAPAIDACETILRKDPLREQVYRRLMSLHVCSGDKGQALRVYRDCTTLFEELFGESPTPLTSALAQAIAHDDPAACEFERWAGG